MTLDIVKFITNAVKTQAKIHHLDVSTKTVKKVPESVSKLIFEQYGEKYLLDADYVSFFWGNIEKDEIEKLFNVVDKALGKSANRLTESDFKKLEVDFKPSASAIASSNDEDNDNESDEGDDDVDEEPTNDESNEDAESNDESDDEPNGESDDEESEDEESEDDESDDEELNEDDISDNETVVEPKYYFLKITIK